VVIEVYGKPDRKTTRKIIIVMWKDPLKYTQSVPMCQPTSTTTKSPLKLFGELETRFLGMLHIGPPFFSKKCTCFLDQLCPHWFSHL